jgi:phage terminase large subunit GpA-like protein
MSKFYVVPNRAINRGVWSAWLPRPRVNTFEWICRHVRDKDGRPFDPESFPWVRGVCEAFDHPAIREIDLQWATRIGKTFAGHAIHECIWATNPMPTMFNSSAEHLAKATVADEIYPMLEHCDALAGQLLPSQRRSMTRVKLPECTCRIGWAGSESRLASYGCWFLHGTEIDKYPLGESTEGDKLGQLLERVIKQFPDHKLLLESSPARAGASRIAPRVRNSTNSRFQVPCPWCHESQQLLLGNNDPREGGLVWDRNEDGSDDLRKAYDTARYVCRFCKRDIHDEHRPRMMRHGDWVAEGQSRDRRGRLHGEPLRPLPAWGSQLSSLYALSLRWGDVARKKVEADPRAPDRQIFTGGWLAEEFEEGVSKTEPEQLGERLEAPGIPRAVAPRWARFLTASVDRQEWGFPVMVCAWGPGERGHLVEVGSIDTWEDVLAFLDQRFEWQGTDKAMGIALSFVDRGFKPHETDQFCKAHSTQARKILPCEGDKGGLSGKNHRKKLLGQDVKNLPKRLRRAALQARGIIAVEIAGHYWESLIQDYFDKPRPGQPGSFSMFEHAGDDIHLCEQLLNAKKSEKLNGRGGDPIWEKRWPDKENDFRDTLRYARCAAEVFARKNWHRQAAALLFSKKAATRAASEPKEVIGGSGDTSAQAPEEQPSDDDGGRNEFFPDDNRKGFW